MHSGDGEVARYVYLITLCLHLIYMLNVENC